MTHLFHPKGSLPFVNWDVCRTGFLAESWYLTGEGFSFPNCGDNWLARILVTASDEAKDKTSPKTGKAGNTDWVGTAGGEDYLITWDSDNDRRYWNTEERAPYPNSSRTDAYMIYYCGREFIRLPPATPERADWQDYVSDECGETIEDQFAGGISGACVRDEGGQLYVYVSQFVVPDDDHRDVQYFLVLRKPFVRDVGTPPIYPAENGWEIVGVIDLDTLIPGGVTHPAVSGGSGGGGNLQLSSRATPAFWSQDGSKCAFVVWPAYDLPFDGDTDEYFNYVVEVTVTSSLSTSVTQSEGMTRYKYRTYNEETTTYENESTLPPNYTVETEDIDSRDATGTPKPFVYNGSEFVAVDYASNVLKTAVLRIAEDGHLTFAGTEGDDRTSIRRQQAGCCSIPGPVDPPVYCMTYRNQYSTSEWTKVEDYLITLESDFTIVLQKTDSEYEETFNTSQVSTNPCDALVCRSNPYNPADFWLVDGSCNFTSDSPGTITTTSTYNLTGESIEEDNEILYYDLRYGHAVVREKSTTETIASTTLGSGYYHDPGLRTVDTDVRVVVYLSDTEDSNGGVYVLDDIDEDPFLRDYNPFYDMDWNPIDTPHGVGDPLPYVQEVTQNHDWYLNNPVYYVANTYGIVSQHPSLGVWWWTPNVTNMYAGKTWSDDSPRFIESIPVTGVDDSGEFLDFVKTQAWYTKYAADPTEWWCGHDDWLALWTSGVGYWYPRLV